MKNSAVYNAVPKDEKRENAQNTEEGQLGQALFQLDGPIKWYLIGIIAYAFAAIGGMIYILTSPSKSPSIKVFPTGNWTVDQFYSGLVLSFLLIPPAIIIRKLAYDLALLHPFAVASTTPTEVLDLDMLMDPGFWSMLHLFKFSVFLAIVQGFLLVSGAILVPVGTLLVYTGRYSTPSPGVAVVGIPTDEVGTMHSLSLDMGLGSSDDLAEPLWDDLGFFTSATTLFTGNLIQHPGVLPITDNQLGPVSTANLTYEEGVRYHGVVTYKWKSGCEYTDSIKFTASADYQSGGTLYVNVTWPDGTAGHATSFPGYPGIALHNSTLANQTTAFYYVICNPNVGTVNLEQARAASAIQTVISPSDTGGWISRVFCTPDFQWEVSSCVWQNSTMTDCRAAPGTNTSSLNNLGLDRLKDYFNAFPMALSNGSTYGAYGNDPLETALLFTFNTTEVNAFRAPFLSDYDKMYGLAAKSLATLTTSGYYGTADVPTTGLTFKPVYLVRLYILFIVMAILVLCPILIISVLYWNYLHHVPLRKATFLTVANAVRGSWWDKTLFGGCVMPHSQLVEKYRGIKVMFGVDEQVPNHVGFAPEILPVQKQTLYHGHKQCLRLPASRQRSTT
jgi:hypothetical protein